MKVFTGSAEAALNKAAEAVLSLVRTKPDCVLALSASSQLDGVYERIRGGFLALHRLSRRGVRER